MTSLLKAEQLLLNPDGLPTRPYYKHMLYAPGTLHRICARRRFPAFARASS